MCAYDSACVGDNVRAFDSVRDCDTAYVYDMLPHSNGILFRALFDSNRMALLQHTCPSPDIR